MTVKMRLEGTVSNLITMKEELEEHFEIYDCSELSPKRGQSKYYFMYLEVGPKEE